MRCAATIGPLPPDIIWRTESALNDPDCKDAVHARPLRGNRRQALSAKPAGMGGADSGRDLLREQRPPAPLFAAVRTQVFLGHGEGGLRSARGAYGGHPDRAPSSWQAPPANAPGRGNRASPAARSRASGSRAGTSSPSRGCPMRSTRAHSGVSVTVRLPDGRELADQEVVVEDLFIVALGDSFASGESNPDRPVQFSPAREMVYDPIVLTAQVESKSTSKSRDDAAATGLPRATTRPIPRCCRGGSWMTRRPNASISSPRPSSLRRSRKPPPAGSVATATARNMAIHSGWRSSLRSRTAIAR